MSRTNCVTEVIVDAEPSLGGQLSTQTEYLPGLKTRVTNPNGSVTTTTYQAFDAPSYDSPVLIETPDGTQPQGITTTIVRDVFGKPLSVTRTGPGG